MTLDHLSGPWRCRWTQHRRSATEDLALTIAGGKVSGSWDHLDGVFDYSGAIHEDGTATLTKVYSLPTIVVPPSLTYIGRWDGRCIAGRWIDDLDPSWNNGPFRMWPGEGPDPGLSSVRSKDLEGSPEAELALCIVRRSE